MTDLPFLVDCLLRLARGIPLTLQLAALSVAAGFCLAMLLALVQRGAVRPLAWFARAYVFVFRGSPLLVQIYLLYYGPGQFEAVRKSIAWSVLREPYWCALISLSLVTAAYGSEIIRGGLDGVPKGLVEAGQASGLSRLQNYRLIILPLAFRNALPAYGNEIIVMVKATSLASVITLMDVTGIAYRLISETYRVMPVILLSGAVYLAVNALVVLAVDWGAARLERPPGDGRRNSRVRIAVEPGRH